MARQTFPVLEALRAHVQIFDTFTKKPLAAEWWPRSTGDVVARKAVKVNAQIGFDLFDQDKRETWTVERDFGNLRLPFSMMWFEWAASTDGAITHHAALVTEDRLPDGNFELTTRNIALWTGRRPYLFGYAAADRVLIDPTGRSLDHKSEYAYDERTQMLPDGPVDGVQAATCDAAIAYITVGLMNCKNVDVHEVREGNPRSSKPAERKRAQRVSYHTIVLPGMSGGNAGGREYQDVMALHRVRGHFKTYTPEAPLLGQHAGTYWWGWQVRGNKKNGVSVTDYKIGEGCKVSA